MEIFQILFALAIWLLVSYLGWKKKESARRAAAAPTVEEAEGGVPPPEAPGRTVADELRDIVRQLRGEFEEEQSVDWPVPQEGGPESGGMEAEPPEIEEVEPARTVIDPVVSRAPRRRRSSLAADLMRDLTAGPHSLSRAVLLREVLGPPIALREPGSDLPGAQ